jgi:hypothetical protein
MTRKPQSSAASARTVRASEIGSYLYCRRAWWYQRQGQAGTPSAARESGLAWHRLHGRRVLLASGMRIVGWLLILLAAAAAAAVAARALIG